MCAIQKSARKLGCTVLDSAQSVLRVMTIQEHRRHPQGSYALQRYNKRYDSRFDLDTLGYDEKSTIATRAAARQCRVRRGRGGAVVEKGLLTKRAPLEHLR